MAIVTLLTGGVRSGKSAYALDLAGKCRGPKSFIATAVPFDDEMKRRIDKHKADRDSLFKTIEAPYDLAAAISGLPCETGVAVVDCLTVWLGNMFHKNNSDEKRICAIVDQLADAARSCQSDLIMVTNEIGWGIVPENEMARSFRDVAGYANRLVASAAQRVFLMCCGLPLQIKG